MEDGNETLRTMSLNTIFNDVDGYMAIGVKDDKTPTTDETEVSTFTTETLPLVNEKRLDILYKNQDSIAPELLEYLKKQEFRPKEGEGKMSSPVKKVVH